MSASPKRRPDLRVGGRDPRPPITGLTSTTRAGSTVRGIGDRLGRRGRPRRRAQELEPPTPSKPVELETLTAHWQLALDAAERAVIAARVSLPGDEVGRRRGDLTREREQTRATVARVARESRIRPAPWLSPVPLTKAMLGLPATVRGCVFDLEGVLTDSGALHAWAWAEVFDDFLLRLGEKTGWHFIPFDRDAEYRACVDGRLRLEGVRAFLASRGIRVPEGSADDGARSDTVYGLAARKAEALARRLPRQGASELAGARRYLQAAARAGVARAVFSSSTSTAAMLESAGILGLVDELIDAEAIRAGRLRSRPAPDVLFNACRRLAIGPSEIVAFTHSAAGIAAARNAGIVVVGVGEGADGQRLSAAGADRVVPSLSALLDRRLSSLSSENA